MEGEKSFFLPVPAACDGLRVARVLADAFESR